MDLHIHLLHVSPPRSRGAVEGHAAPTSPGETKLRVFMGPHFPTPNANRGGDDPGGYEAHDLIP